MNASSGPGSKQGTRIINEPGLILADGAASPPQPQGPRNHPRFRTAAAGVGGSQLAEIPEEFVTLHQLEIFPTGPDPRKDPRFLAMHAGFKKSRGRGRPRSQPYAATVQQPQKSSAMGKVIRTHSDTRRPQFQPYPAVTSTGVINGVPHPNQGQPRTEPQYRPTSGPQRPLPQSQVEDTNVYLSPYGGYIYQSPDTAMIQLHSDTRGPQFEPCPASRFQSQLVTPTGAINGGPYTNQGQPRMQPQYHPTSGSQYPPQQSQVVHTNVYLSPYGGYVYQSPDMARQDPSAGPHNWVSHSPITHWATH